VTATASAAGELTGSTQAGQPASTPGWPRPFHDWQPEIGDGRRLPVPWVIATDPGGGVAWVALHDHADQAHDGRLCQICGLIMDGVVLLGVTGDRYTNGPGCHPRCMALALVSCPHFLGRAAEGEGCVYRYDGPGPGYLLEEEHHAGLQEIYELSNLIHPDAVAISVAEVRRLGACDPLGVGTVGA
jgi:hypothetical protein